MLIASNILQLSKCRTEFNSSLSAFISFALRDANRENNKVDNLGCLYRDIKCYLAGHSVGANTD